MNKLSDGVSQKPCPYCGKGEFVLRKVKKGYKSECLHCGVVGPYGRNVTECVIGWNNKFYANDWERLEQENT